MHGKRLLIALIILPLFYCILMYLPPEVFLSILIFFTTVALAEFYVMFGIGKPLSYTGIFVSPVVLTVFFFAREYLAEVVILASLCVMAVRLFARRNPSMSRVEISTAVFGILYIPCLMTFQLDLVKAAPEWVVLLYAAVWASDSMAYYVGKSIGRKKLYREISPNKTVAGGVGSLVGGIMGTALITNTLLQQVTAAETIVIGLVVGGATVVGDLVESMFKRDAGVKDSSSLIPGHGGVLDKIDGVTFAGPALYWLCVAMGLFS